MGGLVSALEDQDSQGRIDGALTTCGIVAGGINLNEFQLDGECDMAQLLLPGQQVQLTGFVAPGADASQPSAVHGGEPMLLDLVKQVELAVRARLDELLRPDGLTALQ